MQAGFELKHRLVGALILLVTGIFGIPWLLERDRAEHPASVDQAPAADSDWQSIPLPLSPPTESSE